MEFKGGWLLEVAKHYFTKEEVGEEGKKGSGYKGRTISANELASRK